MKKTKFVSVRVRIEAETREQLALAAKVMQIQLKRVRKLKTLKSIFLGTGVRQVEVK